MIVNKILHVNRHEHHYDGHKVIVRITFQEESFAGHLTRRSPWNNAATTTQKKVIRWESERSNWYCFLVYRDRCPRLLCVPSGNDVALQEDRCRHVDICMRTLRENHLVLHSTLFFRIHCQHRFDLKTNDCRSGHWTRTRSPHAPDLASVLDLSTLATS